MDIAANCICGKEAYYCTGKDGCPLLLNLDFKITQEQIEQIREEMTKADEERERLNKIPFHDYIVNI